MSHLCRTRDLANPANGPQVASSGITPPSSFNRSRVSNGSTLFLDGVDGRSQLARRYRDLVGEFTSDLGGSDRLSEGERQLIRRAACLAIQCERAETSMAGGDDLDLQNYVTASNALRRIVATLGLQRRARDVTPSLSEYLAKRGAV